jgi:hypothetical protein
VASLPSRQKLIAVDSPMAPDAVEWIILNRVTRRFLKPSV